MSYRKAAYPVFRRLPAALCLAASILLMLFVPSYGRDTKTAPDLQSDFAAPPDSARPWVYWFFKNGNITREGITADLEAMHRVGIGGVILMEVALTVPQGPVPFFSKPWRELFGHAVAEADRLGLKISINSAPGWTGSGGQWVTPEQSMQKVTASAIAVTGPQPLEQKLGPRVRRRDLSHDLSRLL